MKFLPPWLIGLISSLILAVVAIKPVHAQDPKTYIHPRAIPLLPVISSESKTYFPELKTVWYFPGLIEHESCISLKHSKCWNSRSELKTYRERGLGLGQLTAAWDKNGKLRFDNLATYRKLYPKELGELSWDTYKDRPDLQIRTMIFMVRDDYRKIQGARDEDQRLKMADSSYNGGRGSMENARKACRLTKGCDASVWDNNAEKYCTKSRLAMAGSGGRSPCDLHIGHVRDVFDTRMPKFKKLMDKT